MKNTLALLGVLFTSFHPALAGGAMITCNAKNIVIVGGELVDLTVIYDANPTDTLLGWSASPNDTVIIFCRNSQLTIAVNGEKPIRMVLTPQEGSIISQ